MGYLASLIIGLAAAFAAGGLAGVEYQGGIMEGELAKLRGQYHEAARLFEEEKAKTRELRNQRARLREDLAAARDVATAAHQEKVTEARIIYEQTDPNADNCGFSDDGMRVWNLAALRGGVRETQPPLREDNAGALAAGAAVAF